MNFIIYYYLLPEDHNIKARPESREYTVAQKFSSKSSCIVERQKSGNIGGDGSNNVEQS